MIEIPNTVFGLMALMIGSLSAVVVKLYYSNQKLHDLVNAIQETRIADSKETRDKLAEPLREIAQYTELTYDKIIGGK